MRQMQGVLWTKGVLLNPQHLQTQDRYLEDTIDFRMSALAPYPWGFSELVLDEHAISAGEFALSRGAGLFPDGLCFDFPRADEAPPPKPLQPHWGPDQSTLTVFLAIPRYRREGRNVAESQTEASARFTPAVVKRRDENTGLAERDIVLAHKNLRFLAEGESLEGSTTMPVARLVRESSAEVRIDAQFVPPLMDISASPFVLSIARRLVEILSARSTGLSGSRSQRGLGLADFGISDVANFWLLYAVNSFLPLFRQHYHEQPNHRLTGDGSARPGRTHPAELFRTMSELAGALMTFSSSHHPRELPTYDHGAPSEGFRILDELLRELLDTVVPTNAVTLPLSVVEPSIFAVGLDDERQRGAIQAYLAVGADMPQDQLIERASDWIKVASREGIRAHVNQATRGVGLHHVPVAPSVLPVKLGYQYFRVEIQHPEWERIVRSRTFAAWVASNIPDPRIELVLLLAPENA